MPVPESAATLKSFFETSDQPTQTQFGLLIDTFYYLYQDAKNTANTAVSIANSAAALVPQALLKATWNGASYTLTSQTNVASVTRPGGGGTATFRVTWTVPFLNGDYKVAVLPIEGVSNAHGAVRIVAQLTTNIDLQFYQENGASFGTPSFHLIAFA